MELEIIQSKLSEVVGLLNSLELDSIDRTEATIYMEGIAQWFFQTFENIRVNWPESTAKNSKDGSLENGWFIKRMMEGKNGGLLGRLHHTLQEFNNLKDGKQAETFKLKARFEF